MPKTIYIVDDHPIVRKGLADLIEQEPSLAVVGEAASADEAIREIPRTPPDLVILDMSLHGTSGLDLLGHLRARVPGIRVLVLSMHDETLYAERAIRAGARGYVMKHEATGSILAAIRKVLAGDIYLSEEMTSRALERALVGGSLEPCSPLDILSDRELQVFELIGQGNATTQIARKLHLSVKTVETYRAKIKQKLGLSNGIDLVRHAVQWVHER
jgi:DNA-binding NarL/FixJ family response regulator